MNILLTIYRLKNRYFPNFKLCHLPLVGSFFAKVLHAFRLRQNACGVITKTGVFVTDNADSLGILRNGDYGEREQKLFQQLITNGSCILDLGANIGFFSVFFSKLTGSTGTVHSFEPSPEMYRILQKNISINGVLNVNSYMIAAGDNNSSTKLFLNESNTGDNRFFSDADSPESVDCKVQKLDDIPSLRESPVDFIKIDIQGYEFFALKGMETILRLNQRVQIFCEFWPYGLESNNTNPEDLYNFLISLGFIIYDFNNECGLKELKTFSDLAYITPESKEFTDLICSRTTLDFN